jgi:hypothetical protein
MGIETADGKQNFKLSSILFFPELSSPSGILLTWTALHAIRRFRMQSDQKGNQLPFATAPKVIWVPLANCQRVMEHRMQIQKKLEGIASGAPLPFANLLKGLK